MRGRAAGVLAPLSLCRVLQLTTRCCAITTRFLTLSVTVGRSLPSCLLHQIESYAPELSPLLLPSVAVNELYKVLMRGGL